MIKEIKKYAKDNNVPILLDDSFNFINNYIKENNIKTVLEVGSAIGYFACNIALNNDVIITTIEKNESMYELAKNNIRKLNLENKIELIHSDALEVNLNKKYDLIFIDAAMGQYIKIFEHFKNNLEENGTIIADNMNFHGYVHNIENIKSRNLRGLAKRTKRYRDFLEENEDFKSIIYEVGDGLSVSKRR